MYGAYKIDPSAIPEGLQGLDDALLEDLYDAAYNYGNAAPQDVRIHRLSHTVPKPIYVTVTVPPSLYRHIYVSSMPSGLRKKGAMGMLLDPQGESIIAVSAGITIADIRSFIAAVDHVFRDHRDAKGMRVRAPVPDVDMKMRVDDVFAARAPVFLAETPEEMRARVDEPSDVVLLGRAKSGEYLYCHRRDRERSIALLKKRSIPTN